MLSTIDLLREDLEAIETQLVDLVKSAPVLRFTREMAGFVVVGAPDFYFANPTGEQLRLQLSLKAAYTGWYERFSLLFKVRSSEAQKRIDAAHRELTDWIELGQNNFSVTPNQDANAAATRNAIQAFRLLLDLRDSPHQETIVVPDTNALTKVSDPAAYDGIAGTPQFTFLLLPTVLAELDNLKVSARDPAYREKVEGVIRRIKGWRKQGSLSQGVTVQKSICV